MERYKLLKDLYSHKFFGFEYYDDIKPTFKQKTSENSLTSLLTLESTVKQCHICHLASSRKNIVFGEGNENADIIFIGEAPGALEDESGHPFVGRSGDMLTKIITNVLEIPRNEVYITNILKCRPHNNATPTFEEASSCKDYLFTQIELIKPKIIVTLGATAYKYLTNDMDVSVSKIRGSIIEFGSIKLIPTYHPSYLLRNPSAKKDLLEDIKKVKALL